MVFEDIATEGIRRVGEQLEGFAAANIKA